MPNRDGACQARQNEGYMNTYIKYAMILAFAMCCFATNATEPVDSAEIHFRQSVSKLEPGYMDNRASLDSLSEHLRDFLATSPSNSISRIRVVGAASPEGSVSINRRLSHQRAARIFDYFNDIIELPDSATTFDFVGRDWHGLYEMVLADSNVPSRNEVISLLEEITSSLRAGNPDNASNLNRLKTLAGGTPYSYLYRAIFPQLRQSRLYVEYHAPRFITDYVNIGSGYNIPVEDIKPGEAAVMDLIPVRRRRPFYMNLRTNMLFDAIALPNIGAEFYVGKNLSVVANWMYGWWDNDHLHRYWRAYGGDLGLRWWFGEKAHEKPLTGHHIGVYAGVVTYDFELGGKGYMGGIPRGTLWDRCQQYAGVEYGYSLPVGRRINIDFTLGIGYLGGEYQKYVPRDNHYVWQSTHRLKWFGPTKAEISLVWLIGCGNFNGKKGGAL